jgi:hypothetical protein
MCNLKNSNGALAKILLKVENPSFEVKIEHPFVF